MNELKIEGTQSTPAIHCDPASGVVTMRGDSYPENSFELFSPVLAWIEDYLRDSEQPLRLRLQLLYLNTSSVKAMMDIFDLLNEAHARGRAVSVHWSYDAQNERVAELAEEFREDCEFPFTISSQAEDHA